MANVSLSRPVFTQLTDRVGDLFARTARSIADYRMYRQTYNELASLSVRELDDLGLAGASLTQIARESVYGK